MTGFSLSSAPANGSVAVSGSVVTYTPRTGFTGTDSFQFTATGPGGTSAPGVVSITVNPPAPAVTDSQFSVPFQTATPITLPISGTFTQVTILNLPSHGLLTVPPPGSRTVTYTPATGFSGTDSFTYSATSPGGTSATGTITLTIAASKPVAAVVSMTVDLNTPSTLDLGPFIAGSGVTGVAIPNAPAHGSVAVNGTKVTYTPRHDFFGSDSFTYMAFGNAGNSEPGIVNVTVIGRPDPSQDRNVVGLVDAQAQAARRFSRAQIGNFQRRLESLHVGPPAAAPDAAEPSAAPQAPAPAASAPATRERAALADPFGRPQSGNGLVPVSFTAGDARPRRHPPGSSPRSPVRS